MQMFPLVSVLFAVVIAAVIVLWKAGASASTGRAVADEVLISNQIPPARDEQG